MAPDVLCPFCVPLDHEQCALLWLLRELGVDERTLRDMTYNVHRICELFHESEPEPAELEMRRLFDEAWANVRLP
jgi:hypothetical protein